MEPIQKRKSGLKTQAALDPRMLDAETAREAARLLVLAFQHQLNEIGQDEDFEMDSDPSYLQLDDDIMSLMGAKNTQKGVRLADKGVGISASVNGAEAPPTLLSQWAEEFGINPQTIVDILKEEAASPTDISEFTAELRAKRDARRMAEEESRRRAEEESRVAQEPVKKDWGKGLSDKKVGRVSIFSRLFGG